MKKYLVVEKYDTIASECENCSNAGVELKYFDYSFECVEEITRVNKNADLNIIGIYKNVESFIVDKDLNVNEVENE